MSVAGAYWRGDEKRKAIGSFCMVSLSRKEDVDEYLTLLRRPRNVTTVRSVRRWTCSMFVGKGLTDVVAKGTALRLRLQEFLRRIQARYNSRGMCPPIGNKLLYITSYHYAKYGKDLPTDPYTFEEGRNTSETDELSSSLYDL